MNTYAHVSNYHIKLVHGFNPWFVMTFIDASSMMVGYNLLQAKSYY